MAGLSLRRILDEQGFHIDKGRGYSMLPMLRPDTDTYVVEALRGAARPMDVVLYELPSGKNVLHRVIETHEDEYIILGDNCTALEHVPGDWVLGRLTAFYRGERRVELTDLRYRLYVRLWCRPWRMRVLALRVRGGVMRRLRALKRRLFPGKAGQTP